jgi:hypothetical protein
MFLFEKKEKKAGKFATAKTIGLLKDAAMVIGLVVALKAAAYLFKKQNA